MINVTSYKLFATSDKIQKNDDIRHVNCLLKLRSLQKGYGPKLKGIYQ